MFNRTVRRSKKNVRREPTCLTAICGIYIGAFAGLVWPVTYCVIGVNLYHKYYTDKQLE